MWHTLEEIEIREDEISVRASTGKDSRWFDGHFPDRPVLPGIAQLSMVCEAIERHLSGGKSPLRLREISRVRFKQVIGPEDPLEIKISRDRKGKDTFSFSIRINGEVACSGTVRADTAIPGDTGAYRRSNIPITGFTIAGIGSGRTEETER